MSETTYDTILTFFGELIGTQDRAIDVLKRKQEMLVRPEKEKLESIDREEVAVLAELEQILSSRDAILKNAVEQGSKAETIQLLCEQLFPGRSEWRKLLENAEHRSRRLRFLATTNWTMTQRSIIHLAQMLEMIETKGQGKTTYKPQKGSDTSQSSGGGFVDRIA